jgi:EAL domain-containing protein (putative c-di-GMP-specific phosphodiesterase class I)
MTCECRTDKRFMLVKIAEEIAVFPEWQELKQLRNWSTVDHSGELMVEVGGASQYVTGRDVVNFLRTVLSELQFRGLVARWLPAAEASPCCGCSLNEEAATCQPVYLKLDDFAPLDATPLVKIMQSGGIQTFFQPIFKRDCKTPWGYECLMRGVADDGSRLMPKQLLDWAAQERLIFMLDRICRETHIRNAAACLPDDVSILINFLPTAIYEPAFCLKTTIAAAKSAGIDPSRVIFEVVETEKVDDSNHLASILNEYRKSGFRVALDDVGSGFAGLTMLADLNPDLIKIDRELVEGAAKSEMHSIIIRALVQIAKESGCLVLAEGVETETELTLMKSFGVDLFQGFLLGRPAPSAEITLQLADTEVL